MFGRRSLEQKLREGKGKRAQATVLSRDFNPSWVGGGQGWDGSGTYRHSVRVAPEGEEPFGAKIRTRANGFATEPMERVVPGLRPGDTAWVLYDPDNHTKVAFDICATYDIRQQSAAAPDRVVQVLKQIDFDALVRHGSVPDPGSEIEKLKTLADLRDRGAITEAEFQAEKAKLLGR